VKQLLALLRSHCQACAPSACEQFDAIVDSDDQHVGLIVNERIINLPPQISPPSFDALRYSGSVVLSISPNLHITLLIVVMLLPCYTRSSNEMSIVNTVTVVQCSGVSFGPHSFSDLDFADDVALLAALLELLVPVLETMASEAASLGPELNWQKTKVQALGSREDVPPSITVLGQEVAMVEVFVYIGSLVHSSLTSQCHHPCGYAESRQTDLEVKNHHSNQTKVV